MTSNHTSLKNGVLQYTKMKVQAVHDFHMQFTWKCARKSSYRFIFDIERTMHRDI